MNGRQLCKLSQKEFVSRCLQTTGVSKSQAIAFYQKLWRVQIDSRQRPSTSDADKKAETIQEPVKERDKTSFQRRIKPGMFVRLIPGASRLEGADIVMIMSPSRPEDFDDAREDRQLVCAHVGPSVMTDAYELFVAQQGTYCVKDMAVEVLMEYDSATRYYYMNL
jgi:kinesin family protein 2/24